MNKLNELGNELIELKHELLKNQSPIVLKSLNQLVDQMLTQEIIDHIAFSYLKDSATDLEKFKEYCLTQSNYCLDSQKLLEIYDTKRLELVEYLNESVEAHELTSKSFLKEESVVLIKTFSFTKEDTCNYFGVNENFCETIYGKKKFVERFVVLRFKKIIDDFIQNYDLSNVPFTLGRTPIFFDEERECYAVEFLIKFKLEALEHLGEQNFTQSFRTLLNRLSKHFNHSMGISHYRKEKAPASNPPKRVQESAKKPIHRQDKPKHESSKPIDSALETSPTPKEISFNQLQSSVANPTSPTEADVVPQTIQKPMDQTTLKPIQEAKHQTEKEALKKPDQTPPLESEVETDTMEEFSLNDDEILNLDDGEVFEIATFNEDEIDFEISETLEEDEFDLNGVI